MNIKLKFFIGSFTGFHLSVFSKQSHLHIQLFLKKIIYFNWRLITTLWWILPHIDMNQPRAYMVAYPKRPSLPSHPSGLSQCTGFECPVSCFKLGLVIYFTYGNIQVSMQFSQIIPPSPSPTESKSLFFISVSLLLSYV